MIDVLDGPYMIDNDSGKWEEHQANSAFQQSHLGFSTYDFKGTNDAIPTIYNIIHTYSGYNHESKRNGHDMSWLRSMWQREPLQFQDAVTRQILFGGAKTKQPRNWT